MLDLILFAIPALFVLAGALIVIFAKIIREIWKNM